MARLEVVSQPEYHLVLTKEEMQFLHDLLYTRVTGNPVLSRRELADKIDRAISDIPGLTHGKVSDMDGMVNCRNATEGG